MSKINLAVLVRVGEENVKAAAAANSLDELRQKVFQDVRNFIAAKEKSSFSRCVPANYAWGQKMYERFGVAFGAVEPALFSFFHVKGKMFQDLQVMDKIASNGVRVFDNYPENSGITTHLIEGNSLLNDPWIQKLLAGEFLHDCGLYSIHHQKAGLDDADNENVRRHFADYAICVLDILGQG